MKREREIYRRKGLQQPPELLLDTIGYRMLIWARALTIRALKVKSRRIGGVSFDILHSATYRYRSLTRPISTTTTRIYTTTTAPAVTPSTDYNWVFFKASLFSTLNNKSLTKEDKFRQLYSIIASQHDLCLSNNNTLPISLPDSIHSWFLQHLDNNNQLYDHLNNLINWDINLSNSPNCHKCVINLLQSTEFDIQLITLEKFISTTMNQEQFINKFIKIYDWNTMVLITNNIVKRGNWEIIPYYLTSLIEKLNQLQDTMNQNISDTRKQIILQKSFLKFLIELLNILSNLNNWKLILPTFQLIIESMNALPSSTLQDNLPLLNKPIIKIIKLLRINHQIDEIFQIISYLDDKKILPNNKIAGNDKTLLNHLLQSFQFQKRLLNEILISLRYFNDPKLSIQFICSAVKSPNMYNILNDLGILNYVYRNQVSILSPREVKEIENDNNNKNNNNSNKFISTNLKFKIDDMAPFLNELYLLIFMSNSETLTPEENKVITLKLYDHYIKKLNKSTKLYYFWKTDTGVIIQFLKTLIYQLHDHSLAYDILLDFFNQKIAKKVRIVTSQSKILKNIDTTGQYRKVPVSYVNDNCPFTLLIQSSNKHLSMNQILRLLSIMQEKNIPLNFNICCSMILRLIRLKRIDDAKVWYDKIFYGQFDINHFILLYYVRKFNWSLPRNVNNETINEIDQLLKKGLTPTKQLLKDTGIHGGNQKASNIIQEEDDDDDDFLFMEDQEADDSIFEKISDCLQKIKVS